MKRTTVLPLAALLVGGAAASAQNFSIPWFTLDSISRGSSGDGFSLVSRIGSPNATSSMAGGGFSLTAGPWSIATVVSSSEAPRLRVQAAPGGILLAWPDASGGFQLQQSASLTAPSWNAVGSGSVLIGTERQVTLPFEPGHRFFRLQRP